ncbi:MAG: hypothetical protein SNJ82_04480 [Gemmataceae bacterium]
MRWLVFLSFLLGVTLLGCGEGKKTPPRVKVSGNVKYDGKAIQSGKIVFESMTPGEIPDPLTITAGLYEGEVAAGKKKVRIYGFKAGKPYPKDTPGGEGVNVQENFVPAKYNAETELAKDVSAPGPHSFDFDLPK